MAANTAPAVDNPLFPVGKAITFMYDGKQRRGKIDRTTADNVLIDQQGYDESARSRFQQFAIRDIDTLRYV